MKLLIVFALVAAAFADEIRVVPLPPPMLSRVSMGQVIVPNFNIDAVKIGLPVMRDEVIAEDAGFMVHFVDGPLDVAAPEVSAPEAVVVEAPVEIPVPEPVMLGEAPLPAYEVADSADFAPEPVQIAEAPMPAFEDVEIEAVRIADAPQEIAVEAIKIVEPIILEAAPVAEEIAPEPVQIADAPLAAIETPVDAVRFVDAPLDVAAPEPVVIGVPAFPAYETPGARASAEPIKIAVPQFRGDYRGKVFDDPRLR